MSRQAQSQQEVGFALGTSATAPTYLIPARSYGHEESELRDTIKATFGSRDNTYAHSLVGYEDTTITITAPMEEKIYPILLASGFDFGTGTGTAPNLTNILNPRNIQGSTPTVEGRKLTFFVKDGANTTIKYTGAILSEGTHTVENNQVNYEFTFVGGSKEVLTGADLTAANTGFTTLKTNLATALGTLATSLSREVSLDDYYHFVRPGYVVVDYSDDYDFGTSTNVKANFGFTFGFNNNVTGDPTSLSASGLYVQPNKYLGQFTSTFEFTEQTTDDDLQTRADNTTPTSFRFLVQRTADRSFEFKFSPSNITQVASEKVGDSDDAVMQTISVEEALNTITYPSLRVTVKSDLNLPTIYS